jgi:hypothetical protein
MKVSVVFRCVCIRCILALTEISMCNADMFMGFEEIDGDDDIREEFPCPFCTEFFDIVGLCCHIDEEHPVEAKNGVLFLVC